MLRTYNPTSIIHCLHYLIASSLFYYIDSHCYKFATSHKKFRLCCPSSIFTHFSQGSILESLVINFFELTKLFNICWNRVLFILYLGSHFPKKLNNFANSDPCEKRVNILGGQHWRNSLMVCSNLVTMAVYVVKQAWCNEIMPTVYMARILQ